MKRLVNLLLAAKGLRAFGDGYVALLLPAYLLNLGYSPLQVGLIATTTLLGSGLLTLLVGLYAHRYHFRSLVNGAESGAEWRSKREPVGWLKWARRGPVQGAGFLSCLGQRA